MVVAGHAGTDRGDVGRQVLGTAERVDVRGGRGERGRRALHDVDAAQEGQHRQPAGVPGGAAGGQHVIRPGEVVAERHGGVRAHEDGAGVADPGRQGAGIVGLDLQVLRRPGVGDGESGVEVVHEHAGGLAVQGLAHPFPVAGGCQPRGQRLLGAVGEAGVGGDQQARGQRVVFRLGDQVGGDEVRRGRVVRDDRHLGRAGLRVGADGAEQQPLGGRHVHIAGPGDDIGGRAVGGAVGEHGDRLRTARRVYLLHAEQGAGGEHGRGGQPAVSGLRR